MRFLETTAYMLGKIVEEIPVFFQPDWEDMPKKTGMTIFFIPFAIGKNFFSL